MKLVIISGRSGAGKGTALDILEDLGFFCIDNLPVALIPDLVSRAFSDGGTDTDLVAVSVDARNFPEHLEQFPEILTGLSDRQIDCEIIYLDADDRTLLKRFSETRRRHPLSREGLSLAEALEREREVLEPIAVLADLNINTTDLTLHQLRDVVRTRVAHSGHTMSLLFESFGFKNGVPSDADLVFDVRCLPNPHWDPQLRDHTGTEQPVIDFLAAKPQVNDMFQDIVTFLDKWLPHFQDNNRSYLTVAIGCTGGKHRSVYLSERLARYYSGQQSTVQVRHRELS